MRAYFLLRVLPAMCVAALSLVLLNASAAPLSQKPLVLDTESAASDGPSSPGGLVVHTAPLPRESRNPAQSAAPATGQQSGSPLVISPYLIVPVGGGASAPLLPVYELREPRGSRLRQ
jgi:hypothetical protein